MTAPTVIRFSVLADATERLDRFLADQLHLSRTVAARLVADGAVRVQDSPARASRLLKRQESVEVQLPANPPTRHLAPAHIPLTIIYEDDFLLVVDKPAGLVVHPAPGHWDDTLVNALIGRGTALGRAGKAGGAGEAGRVGEDDEAHAERAEQTEGASILRPGLVHRLDRDTSGLMVVAKTDLAHRRLAHAIAHRQVRRTYAALAWGHLDQSPTEISAAIGRHPQDRKRMQVRADGRAARTDAFVIARFGVCDLLRLELHTGRTHQIRVHLDHIGHPVVGDPVYAGGGSRRIQGAARAHADRLERATPRQALHAAGLAFRHPETGQPMAFQAEWPADLEAALRLAASPEVVAPQHSLAYLRFYDRDV
jgi:23S rRNA pseudouridine1911/1915/1917 synthase